MLAHCKAGYPNEACGILAGKENKISKIYNMSNAENSPAIYRMDPKEQFQAMKDMRENDLSMISVFHSHPSSEAYPSQTDVKLAFYDNCIYVIVSLNDGESAVRAFTINEGKIEEVEVIVEGN